MKTTGKFILMVTVLWIVVNHAIAQDDAPLFSPEQDYFLDASVDNLSPFVGQQIVYTLRFYAASVPEFTLQEPDFVGFWRGEQTTGRTVENIGGRQYSVTSTNVILYPIQSGRLTIEAAQLTIPATVFSDPVRLNAPEFALNVRALPETPEDFNGAVGRFTLEASVDKTTVTLGEPVALRYRLTGTGNFEQMPPPELNLPDGWRAYRDTDSGEVRALAGGVLSEAVYDWQLIPDRTGSSDFPPFRFVYFDPVEAVYQTAEAAPVRVDVMPSGTVREIPDMSTLGGGAAALTLKSTAVVSPSLSDNLSAWFWLLWLLPPVLAFGVWGGLRWRRWQHEQMLLRKQANALERARKRLQAALDSADQDARVYPLVYDAVRVYLSDKFVTEVQSTADAESLLGRVKNVEIDTRDAVLDVMRAAQDGRYAPRGIVDACGLLRRAAEVITRLDAALPDTGILPITDDMKHGASALIALVMMFAFAACVSGVHAQNASEIMTQAANAYQTGDYQTAVRLYEGLIASGNRSVDLYYNLGSTYFEMDNLGQAMVYFLRAYRLAPRDGDVNLALALVRALRVDIQSDESTLIDNMAVFTSGVISLNEFAWLALGFWTLWFVLVALWFLRAPLRLHATIRDRLRVWLLVVGGVMIILVGLFAARVFVEAERPAAVVTELRTRAMSGPHESYLELFDLYAAAEIRILEERGGWLRVLLPDGLQAWLKQDAVERV